MAKSVIMNEEHKATKSSMLWRFFFSIEQQMSSEVNIIFIFKLEK